MTIADTDLYYLSESTPQYNSWKNRRLKAPSLKATDFQLVDDIVDRVVKKYLGSGYSVNGNYYYARPLTPEECYQPSDDMKILAKYYKAPIIFGTGGEISEAEDAKIWKGLWDINDVTRTQEDEDDLAFRVDIAKKFSFIPIIWDTKDNIELDKQFIKRNTMSKELTEGQKRVRKSFNPSGLKRVEDFKQIMADAIDALNETAEKVNASPNTLIEGMDKGDFLRELATAKTQLQIASMCGVAALTHEIVFKAIGND